MAIFRVRKGLFRHASLARALPSYETEHDLRPEHSRLSYRSLLDRPFLCRTLKEWRAGGKLKSDQTAGSASPSPPCSTFFLPNDPDRPIHQRPRRFCVTRPEALERRLSRNRANARGRRLCETRANAYGRSLCETRANAYGRRLFETQAVARNSLDNERRDYLVERHRNGAPVSTSNLIRRLPRRRHLRLVRFFFVRDRNESVPPATFEHIITQKDD